MRNKCFFLFLLFHLTVSPKDSFADELTLMFYPSPHGLNWESPKTLVRSVLSNYSSPLNHMIGHANVFLSCSKNGFSSSEFPNKLDH